MSYKLPPVPHATYSSALTQTVTSTTTAYPVIFESADDQLGVYHKNSTVTISVASPAVVAWTAHGLTDGAVVVFTTTGALPTGLATGTAYYMVNKTDNDFQVSATLGGAAINTSGTQSGAHTCTCVSRFYVPETGDYLCQISVIMDSSSGAGTIDIWWDVNGSNLAKSNTICAVDGANMSTIAVPLILDLNKGDYVRLFYRGSSNNVRLIATAQQASPTRPACPSVIMTVQKIGM